MRWIWLQKTDPNHPWAHLPVHVPDQVKAFFAVATISEVGGGAHTLLGTDRWLHGQCIVELIPQFFAVISKRRIKRCTVQEALNNWAWITDIQGALTVDVIVDFLHMGYPFNYCSANRKGGHTFLEVLFQWIVFMEFDI